MREYVRIFESCFLALACVLLAVSCQPRIPEYFNDGPFPSLNVPTSNFMNSTMFAAEILDGALSPFSYLKLVGISACGKLQTGTPLPTICNIDLELKCNNPSEGGLKIRGNPVMTHHGVIDVSGGSFELNNGKSKVRGWGYGVFPYLGESSYFELTLVPVLNNKGEYVFEIYGVGYEKAHLISEPIGISCPFSVGEVIYKNVHWAKTYVVGVSWIRNQLPFPTVMPSTKSRLVDITVPFTRGSSWRLGGMFLSSLHVPVNPSIPVGNTDMRVILSCPSNENNFLVSLNSTGDISVSQLVANFTSSQLLSQFRSGKIIFTGKYPHTMYNGLIVELVIARSLYADSAVIYLNDLVIPKFFECGHQNITVSVKHDTWAPLYTSNFTSNCHEYGSSFTGVNLFSIPTFISPGQCQDSCIQTSDCEFWTYNNKDNVCNGYSSEKFSFRRDSSTHSMITGSVSCPCYSQNVNLVTPLLHGRDKVKVTNREVSSPAECQALVLENNGLGSYFVYDKKKRECYKQGVVRSDTLPIIDTNSIVGPSVCYGYIYSNGVSKQFEKLQLLESIKISANSTDHHGDLCRSFCSMHEKCQIFELSSSYECMLFSVKDKRGLRPLFDIIENSWPSSGVILMGISTPLAVSYPTGNREHILHAEVGSLSLDIVRTSDARPASLLRVGLAAVLTTILLVLL
ncbi:apple domain-containing and signal peptide-containing protein [Cryptosporidium canis]|uniref:Apple domain-containing and signal peptide-containing protein n=1 Tax=Cryptosporidium canis TaxID=195482 RepID=A0ABQ8P771_9CRYT|nr:apple domain-containing and signal peptide-containing protein [Cryptosporidium canis]